jgi:hypothetical protein
LVGRMVGDGEEFRGDDFVAVLRISVISLHIYRFG